MRLRRERVAVGWEWAVVVVEAELVVVRSQIDWLEPVGSVGWMEDRMVDHLDLVERRPVGWMEAQCWDERCLVEPQHSVDRWRCWATETVVVRGWVGCYIRQMGSLWEEHLEAAAAAVVVVPDWEWPIDSAVEDNQPQGVDTVVAVDIHLGSFREWLVVQRFVRRHWVLDWDYRVVRSRIPSVAQEVHRHLVVDRHLELVLLVEVVHIDDRRLADQVVQVDIRPAGVVRHWDIR